MDEPPKKPRGIGWYAAWIVLALVLYPLSFGPVLWVATKAQGEPEWLWDVANAVYLPIWRATDPATELVGHRPSVAFRNYRRWWSKLATQ